jgi:uncharacterized protein
MGKSKAKKVEWRSAVQEQMRKATLREAKQRYGSSEPAFNYRWEHVTAVVNLAIRLAGLTNADRDVVEAAAWLHDVRKETGDDHPKLGAQFAREFLPKTDFPKKKIERVAAAIEEHMGLWLDKPLKNLESQVLWDADKLAKIGLTAAFHWTANDIGRNRRTYSTHDLIERGRKQDWLAKTVASMHTKPARRAAKKRLKRYHKLWTHLEQELNGDDLTA